MKNLYPILLLAIVYALVGRLALLLAIPPGYASPIFPASGIALGAVLLLGNRLWPGIWVGSFVMNLGVSAAHGDRTMLLTLAATSAAIACGASLQAVLGARLVRRAIGFPNALVTERAIGLFLALAILSCVINATIGISSLHFAGVLLPGEFLFNWWNWWVGDALGVLVLTPVTIAAFARPRELWKGRAVFVGLPLLLAFFATTAFYVYSSANQQAAVRADFGRRTGEITNEIEQSLNRYLEMVHSIRSLFTAVPTAGAEAFRSFTGELLATHPGVQAIAWNRFVKESDRTAWPRPILEVGPDGETVPANSRPYHVVVELIAPADENRIALGLDITAEPIRRAAIEKAARTGKAVVSSHLKFMRPKLERWGFLILDPVFVDPKGPLQLSNLKGCVVAGLRTDEVVEAAIAKLPQEGIYFDVRDVTESDEGNVLHVHGQRDGAAAEVWETGRLEVAGRRFLLTFSPTKSFVIAQKQWGAWAILACGLFFSGLLGAFLLVVSGRRILLQKNADELAATNAELEQFAYVASHDLQEPLRVIVTSLQLLEKRRTEKLSPQDEELMGFAVEGASRMQSLVRDLLSLARVGKATDSLTNVALDGVVREAQANLRTVIDESGAVIAVGPLPTVKGNSTLLVPLFQNLIGNAIKYRAEAMPSIQVRALRRRHHWLFPVQDNGIGLDPRYSEKIYGVLQRLHSDRKKYQGTGIGLAICKKIVDFHRGRIWVESTPGHGATFFFTLPSEEPGPVPRDA